VSRATRRAVWILGAGQCVYWGILYYAFAVLLVPMRHELAASESHIAGAFSVGLGISALLSARAGRWMDRGHGITMLRHGAVLAAALLVAWSFADSVVSLYVVWLGLGACMAFVLYESAFAVVIRAVADSQLRLRALASVTVMGGLASTVFLPITAIGIETVGWRVTLRALAIAWLLTAWWQERTALPVLGRARTDPPARREAIEVTRIDARRVWQLGAPFVAGTLAAMTLTTLVIPMLVKRGHPLAVAAWVLAAFGIMQLPGRLWIWHRGGLTLSGRNLLVVPLALQAAGLAIIACTSGLGGAAVGVAMFGIGAGLHTLARPWAVAHLFGVDDSGRINGAIARSQSTVRAIGPFLSAYLYGRFGPEMVFGGLSVAIALFVPLAWHSVPATPKPSQRTG
jgi:hypothetical protein